MGGVDALRLLGDDEDDAGDDDGDGEAARRKTASTKALAVPVNKHRGNFSKFSESDM